MERQGLGRRLASTVFAFSGPLDSRLVREGEEGREGVREGRQEGRGDRSVSVAFLSDPPPPLPTLPPPPQGRSCSPSRHRTKEEEGKGGVAGVREEMRRTFS